MVKKMAYEENYFDICETTGYKTVVYGAGMIAQSALPYLKNISYICDKRADKLKELNGIKIIKPDELVKIKEVMLIVICVRAAEIRDEINVELSKLPINAFVFDYFNNIAFDLYREKVLINCGEKKRINDIRLVCVDKGWILRKFAVRMKEELEKQGYRCTIGKGVDPTADINHHVIYTSCQLVVPYHETFMFTHIDSYNTVELVKHQLKKAMMGICMSRETMERMAAYGVPREKLCYINPAQDGVIKPKKYILGITHKTHEDHRKNENVLITLCKELNPNYFSFKIMGSGWGDIVEAIRDMGFHVEYFDDFDYEEYTKLMPSLDYYLYWGFDEGSMGYLDALRAGVKTIVTPQGYHLDVRDGITYPCRTILDFKDVLLKLQEERKRIVDSVEDWTWKNFVNKHLEVWNYLLGNEEGIYKNQHLYEDGIFSVLRMDA